MPLSVKDGMGAWVKDFQDSNAPQFKGKSDKERREMAIAAYLSAKRGDQNESVEEAKRTVTIDKPDRLVSMKVSKDKPPFTPDPPKPQAKNSDGSTTSPMSRASQLARQARDRQKVKESRESVQEVSIPGYPTMPTYPTMPGKGQKKPTKKNEKTVQELKKSTYAKYINKASAQAVGHSDEAGYQAGKHEYDGDPDREAAAAHLAGKADKRLAGIKRATKALSKEGTVQELKKSTLGSYVKKASQDAGAKAYSAAQKAMSNPDQSGKDYVKSVKRQKGIAKATDKLTKEAKSFDQKFKDHLKFAVSKSPAVQAYMKKRKADRDAAHAKQDPAAVKKNYGPAVIPPGTAYNKASKRGMNPSQAANAVSNAFKNRAKGGKLPK